MKKSLLVLSFLIANVLYPANIGASSSIAEEDCTDIAFDHVELYYDNGGSDNIEAGYVFYAVMYICETKKRN
jgi:hypothetical protein